MSAERPIIITDSGCSMRPEFAEVKEKGVLILPLKLSFYENGEYVSCDDLSVTPEEFYQRMRSSEKLPQTSGSVEGEAAKLYSSLPENSKVISIHITSKHSVAFNSARLAKEFVATEKPDLLIEVIDSRQLSLGQWYLTELAAELSLRGAGIDEIKAAVLETIPKIQILAALESFDNLKKGGRANEVMKAVVASVLRIYPVLGLKEGKLEQFTRVRSAKKAREKLVEITSDSGKLTKLSIVHANSPELAEEIRMGLAKFRHGNIPIYEIGPVLGVHTGEGTVGVVFQKI